jgi:hypothetical protein
MTTEITELNDNLETLGMYGIGMKRAIFKIGLEADVITWKENQIFKVHIPENWSTIPEWLFNYSMEKKQELKIA